METVKAYLNHQSDKVGVEPKDDLPVFSKEDKQYYSKLYILTNIYGTKPITTVTGARNVFANDVHDLQPAPTKRTEKDLPLADLLALLMVSRAKGDVAAVTILNPKPGHIHIVVAKNETSEIDAQQMSRLLGLLWGDITKRYENFDQFVLEALKFVTTYCHEKMKKRAHQIDTKFLSEVIGIFQTMEISNFQDANIKLQAGVDVSAMELLRMPVPKMCGADQNILDAARQSRMPIEKCFASLLDVVRLALQDKDLLQDHVRLFRAMVICDRIYSSHIFDRLATACRLNDEQLNELQTDLGKFSAYFRALDLLFRALEKPVMEGMSPLRIRCQLLRSHTKVSIPLAGNGWYDLLKDFSLGCGGHKDLRLSKEYLEEQWGKPTALRGRRSRYGFRVPDHTHTSFHCELRLVHYLNSRGIFGGIVGVSKLCCEMCSVALAGMNELGDSWMATGGDGELCLGLLPLDEMVKERLVATVNRLLRNELDKLHLRAWSPVCQFHDVIDDGDSQTGVSYAEILNPFS